METITAVECIRCHALHRREAETYIRLLGGLYVGMSGGLVGPESDVVWCLPCFRQDAAKWTGLEGYRA